MSGSQPGKSKRKWTENQAKHLSRFECAKEYGRRAVADPVLSAHYAVYRTRWKRKLKHTGIYQLAIMDFMRLPEICKASLERSGRMAGSLISITAMDQFEISRVEVSLLAPDGIVLEEGMAGPAPNHVNYAYVILNSGSMKPGTLCVVRVWDFPGNVAEKEFRFFD